MKTPDEIKKGLECCNEICDSKSCPYWEDSECPISVRNDALAYIKQLEAERDAAVACIPRECGYCKHDGTADFDVDSVCDYCLNGNTRWEWRGVQKEDSND